MTLRADFSFTGYIRVEMELVRPITVAGVNSAKGDIFYLPKNTVKAIYLTSSNTASQVVNALLQKVLKNFRKFISQERKTRKTNFSLK